MTPLSSKIWKILQSSKCKRWEEIFKTINRKIQHPNFRKIKNAQKLVKICYMFFCFLFLFFKSAFRGIFKNKSWPYAAWFHNPLVYLRQDLSSEPSAQSKLKSQTWPSVIHLPSLTQANWVGWQLLGAAVVTGATVDPADGSEPLYNWQPGLRAMLRSSIAISPWYPLPLTAGKRIHTIHKFTIVNYQ